MAEIRVRAFGPDDLPDVAAYLARLAGGEAPPGEPFDIAAATRNLEVRLRWQLLENPVQLPEPVFGYLLRDAEGQVVGTYLAIPQRFAFGDRSLLGLLGADMRAESHAARFSSGMFLAYLRLGGVDFHYATTANREGGAFWEQRRSTAVPESDIELIRPLRFEPIVEEIALRRGISSRVAGAVGLLGLGATWLVRAGARRTRAGLVARPCADWERLAAVAEAHRGDELTHERSAAYLRWRYAECPGADMNRVLLVEDRLGNQAFAALQLARVGVRRQIRELRLMDLVWPRDRMDLPPLVRALLRADHVTCDMVRIKGGTLPARVAPQLGFRVRRLEASTSYIAGFDAQGQPLALRARLVGADSDTP